ncbi:MAG TPA: hypothetical protein VGP99_07845 [Tepidisphaeraceae bacterium]|nr:hypothetical protein [Tepidisphaeraceae bacterium]
MQVVGLGDILRVPEPRADDVPRQYLGQLRLPGRPQVVEQFGPGFKASAADDPLKLGPQIAILHPVLGDDELTAFGGLREDLHQRLAQLRKERDEPVGPPLDVLGLG